MDNYQNVNKMLGRHVDKKFMQKRFTNHLNDTFNYWAQGYTTYDYKTLCAHYVIIFIYFCE